MLHHHRMPQPIRATEKEPFPDSEREAVVRIETQQR